MNVVNMLSMNMLSTWCQWICCYLAWLVPSLYLCTSWGQHEQQFQTRPLLASHNLQTFKYSLQIEWKTKLFRSSLYQHNPKIYKISNTLCDISNACPISSSLDHDKTSSHSSLCFGCDGFENRILFFCKHLFYMGQTAQRPQVGPCAQPQPLASVSQVTFPQCI